MAIERRWVVVCDGCCATTPEGYAPTKREAARLATGAGYRNFRGRLLCEGCRVSARGEK